MPDIYLKDKNGIPRKYEDISAVRFVGDPLGTEYVTYSEGASLIALTVNPSRSSQHIEPPTGYTGFSEVNVNPVTNVTAENIKAGQTILDVTGTYTASNNPITAGDVLSGKEGFVNGGSVIVGNMPNNGAGSWTLDDVADLPLSISPGYYSSGTITIDSTSLTNLAAGNIKKDVEILGITGSYEGSWATGASVTVTPYVLPQTILPSDEGVDCFTEVDVDAVPYSEVANTTGTTAVIGSSSKVQIVTGTYTSKNRTGTDYDDYEEVMINIPWTWNGNSYSILWVRYLPEQEISYLRWIIGNPTNLTPPYGNINLRGYVRLNWNSYFWTSYGTAEPGTAFTIHIDTTTTVTPRQYRIFTKYFQRTGN